MDNSDTGIYSQGANPGYYAVPSFSPVPPDISPSLFGSSFSTQNSLFNNEELDSEEAKMAPLKAIEDSLGGGKKTSCFVGNIPDSVPNEVIEHILMCCGHLKRWNRVQDPSTGQLKCN